MLLGTVVNRLAFAVSQWKKDIYVLDQFLKYLLDKHFNMGVINVPQSPANRLHLWIWHRGKRRFMIWRPCFFLEHLFPLQHSVSVNPLICCSPLPLTPWISFESFLSNLPLPLFSLLFSTPSVWSVTHLPAVFLYLCVLPASMSLSAFFFTLLL